MLIAALPNLDLVGYIALVIVGVLAIGWFVILKELALFIFSLIVDGLRKYDRDLPAPDVDYDAAYNGLGELEAHRLEREAADKRAKFRHATRYGRSA